jgi:hypothetical protein
MTTITIMLTGHFRFPHLFHNGRSIDGLLLVLVLLLLPMAAHAYPSPLKNDSFQCMRWGLGSDLPTLNTRFDNSGFVGKSHANLGASRWPLSPPIHAFPMRKSSSRLYSRDDDGDENEDWMLSQKIENANPLEIRLDATLASCYGLCRFLIFDITTGAKDVPGWQMSDFIMLGGAFSSCIILSLIWVLIGTLTGIFESRYSDDYDLLEIASTAAIVGPLWLLVEILSGWPPGGVMMAQNFADDSSNILYTIGTGTVGLMSVMCLGKTFTSGWR